MDLHSFKMCIAQLLIIDDSHDDNSISEPEDEDEDDPEHPRNKQAGRPGRVYLPLPAQRREKALHLPKAMDLVHNPIQGALESLEYCVYHATFISVY